MCGIYNYTRSPLDLKIKSIHRSLISIEVAEVANKGHPNNNKMNIFLHKELELYLPLTRAKYWKAEPEAWIKIRFDFYS